VAFSRITPFLKDGNHNNIVVVSGKTKEYNFGLVIQCAPKKYLETKNPMDHVPGVGPVIVNRSDRAIHEIGSRPPGAAETFIADYEKKWKAKN
jgi:hypothetical protein